MARGTPSLLPRRSTKPDDAAQKHCNAAFLPLEGIEKWFVIQMVRGGAAVVGTIVRGRIHENHLRTVS